MDGLERWFREGRGLFSVIYCNFMVMQVIDLDFLFVCLQCYQLVRLFFYIIQLINKFKGIESNFFFILIFRFLSYFREVVQCLEKEFQVLRKENFGFGLGKGCMNLDYRYKENLFWISCFFGKGQQVQILWGREFSILELGVRSEVGMENFEIRKFRWVLWGWGVLRLVDDSIIGQVQLDRVEMRLFMVVVENVFGRVRGGIGWDVFIQEI